MPNGYDTPANIGGVCAGFRDDSSEPLGPFPTSDHAVRLTQLINMMTEESHE